MQSSWQSRASSQTLCVLSDRPGWIACSLGLLCPFDTVAAISRRSKEEWYHKALQDLKLFQARMESQLVDVQQVSARAQGETRILEQRLESLKQAVLQVGSHSRVTAGEPKSGSLRFHDTSGDGSHCNVTEKFTGAIFSLTTTPPRSSMMAYGCTWASVQAAQTPTGVGQAAEMRTDSTDGSPMCARRGSNRRHPLWRR